MNPGQIRLIEMPTRELLRLVIAKKAEPLPDQLPLSSLGCCVEQRPGTSVLVCSEPVYTYVMCMLYVYVYALYCVVCVCVVRCEKT